MTDIKDTIARIDKMIAEDEARIDIADPIRDICQRLGLDSNIVARLDITPSEVTAELYAEEEGSKRITARGNVALERETFKVRT